MNHRVAVIFISRKKGIPVNQSHFPFLGGGLYLEDLDVGVGIFGSSKKGRIPMARVGIYNFMSGSMKFHHAIDLNTETGEPVLSQRRESGSKTLIGSDRAIINWIKPLLFMDDRYPCGSYRWIDDPPVDLSLVDADEKRRIVGLSSFTPEKLFFSMDRTVESSGLMVDKFIEPNAGFNDLSPPDLFPLLLQSRMGGKIHEGVAQIRVPISYFRSMVLQKMITGLRSRDGAFRDIRFGFLNSMIITDQMISKGANRSLLEATIRRSEAAFRSDAKNHLARQKLPPLVHKECSTMVESAISALMPYYSDRNKDGILMCGISSDNPSAADSLKEGLFSRPDFLIVKPTASIQVVDGKDISFDFPEDGSLLFTNERH